MRLSCWRAIAIAAVVASTSSASAQYVPGPGMPGTNGTRIVAGLQPKRGAFGQITYVATIQAQRSGILPFYGQLPPLWFPPQYIPVPVVPPQQPPVIIQNIVQAPATPPAANRGPAIPNEFDPAPPKGKAGIARGPAPAPMVQPPAAAVAAPAARVPNRADADRAVDAGRKAFADGQYGRAGELFARAAAISPDDAAARFLMSQAYFAVGKYREAVAAIATGVQVAPDWAAKRFQVKDLYWKAPNLYADHIKALRDSLTAFPDDPLLHFLLGHQLWFEGKKDEAVALFQKAQTLGKDQSPAAVFLADRR